MATFGQIKARVARFVIDVPAVTETEIPAFVNRACRFAQEVHNFRVMEATIEQNTVTGQRLLIAKPSDWKEMRADPWLLFNDGGREEIRWLPSESESVRQFNVSATTDKGAPEALLETETDLQVFPFPDGLSDWSGGQYRVRVPYWKYLPALSADGDTNWFTLNAEDYVTYKAVAEALLLNREEERGSLWAARAGEFDANTGRMTGELARLVRVDKRSRLGRRITLSPVRDVYAPNTQRRDM